MKLLRLACLAGLLWLTGCATPLATARVGIIRPIKGRGTSNAAMATSSFNLSKSQEVS